MPPIAYTYYLLPTTSGDRHYADANAPVKRFRFPRKHENARMSAYERSEGNIDIRHTYAPVPPKYTASHQIVTIAGDPRCNC